MDPSKVKCHFCSEPCYYEGKGIIFVRAKVGDRWTNVPTCITCWRTKYRNDKQVEKIKNISDKLDERKKDFDATKFSEEALDMLSKTPDDKKFQSLLSNMPKEIKSLQKIATTMWHLTESMAEKYPHLVCKEFMLLNKIAMEKEVGEKENAKHRRACMQHPWLCKHPHCKELAKFLTATGMDKMSHPDYGTINKQISKSEEDSVEELK